VNLENLHPENRCVAVEFKLTYNDTFLKPIDVAEGPYMAAAGLTLFISRIENWPPHGPHVLVGIQLMELWPLTTFPSGNGTLATITFEVLYRPVGPPSIISTLGLRDTMLLNDTIEEIPHETRDGYVELPQVGIHLGLEPPYVLGGVIGSEFDVNVTIEVDDVDLNVTSVAFRLLYCATLLEIVNVDQGPFLAQFGPTFFINYTEDWPPWGPNLLVGILLLPPWTTFPSGTGTLTTITFKVLSRPVAPDTAFCLLELVDSQVLNDEVEAIYHTSDECLYEALQIFPPTLTVDPNPVVVGGVIGSEFSVDVTMNALDVDWNTTAVQFRLQYCEELLEFVSVTEGSFMAAAGPTYFMNFTEDWPPWGWNVLVGVQLLSYPPHPSGSGTLATITFKVLDRPVAPDIMWCLLDLKDTLILDDEIEEIPHGAAGSLYKASQIFPPTLKVEPPLVELNTAYQLFDINVTMNDLDADWNCTIVEFKLVYNGTLLEAVDVVEGPFPPLFGDTLFINYTEQFAGESYVLIGILWWDPDPFPHGTGTLATITFNATYQGRDPLVALECDLILADTLMLDEYWNVVVNEIPHYTEDGHYIIYSTHFADVNRDGKVDMKDIGAIALAFGTSPENPGDPPRWNEAYDVNYDGKIDMKDVAIAARNFGWPYD
jgi:hypothetical protein